MYIGKEKVTREDYAKGQKSTLWNRSQDSKCGKLGHVYTDKIVSRGRLFSPPNFSLHTHLQNMHITHNIASELRDNSLPSSLRSHTLDTREEVPLFSVPPPHIHTFSCMCTHPHTPTHH